MLKALAPASMRCHQYKLTGYKANIALCPSKTSLQTQRCSDAGSAIELCVMGMQNLALELQYKTCYARVLDSKRRFLQAATQYYELSQVENVRSGPGQVR